VAPAPGIRGVACCVVLPVYSLCSMEAEAKHEGHMDSESLVPDEHSLASIQVTSLGGKEMANLKEDVKESVVNFKKKVIKESGCPRLTEIDLFLDGKILPCASTLAAAGLKAGESYTMSGLLSQHWILDDSKKGDGVALLEESVVKNTVEHGNPCNPGACRIILGKTTIPMGRHHFRVRLLEGSYYYIGVAEEGVNLNMWLGSDLGRGWSYYLRDNRSGSRLGPGYRSCGPPLSTGDFVTFCFDTEGGTLEYAQNDEELKPAQTGLAGKELYLALGMGPNGVTLKLEDAWRER